MQYETAKAIVDAAESLSLEMSISKEYSGRGMFGGTTTGINYESEGDLLQAIAKAAQAKKDDEIDEFVEDLAGLRKDNMGRSSMIIY